MLYDELHARARWVESQIGQLRQRIESAPAGELSQSCQRGTARFYRYVRNGDPSRTYLPESHGDEIRALAQKGYDTRALGILQRESALLNKLLKADSVEAIRALYNALPAARKPLVIPIDIGDEEYAQRWQAEPYEHKPLGESHFETFRGELVRSKSEMIIANELARRQIPYHYEQPLRLAGMGLIHPDFHVLNKRTRKALFWEHFGMMGDADYQKDALRRLDCYAANGYLPGRNLIVTFESTEKPLNVQTVRKSIEEYCL